MDIQMIILDLIHRKIIDSKLIEFEKLNGGTISELYLLNSKGSKYVVKLNEPKVIESEAHFLHSYKDSNLLPKLLFVEQSYKYIVYSFIDGATNYNRKDKKDMLKALVQGLLNHYKSVPDIGWGWMDQPAVSWQCFLKNKILEANKLIDSRLEIGDHHFVLKLVEEIKTDRKPYLLHGDCGVHNFIFNDGRLIGVIDPTPVIGEPLYDLIYAFCSSPDDLTKETLDSAVSEWMIKSEHNHPFLYLEVMIGLYLRLGTCIKHHPQDFEEYLTAWHYWKNIIKKL
ncbi:aminoglycoside phosphotransferase family protein [Niallia endozanthoxylica]|uniref:Aminoglycoside phosphotransferase family protein n=2 Tax=Niallia endozanthoxylica TaxID=2036016 RepID=A0A5J5HT09_9BACI|nr:aminoglycoside phosphotransferase family protein [Niallia endozanthoxylica]